MADDIDIEEHDVMENPVIRNIFPDISVIKKEISQYFEDVPEICQAASIKDTQNHICPDIQTSHNVSLDSGKPVPVPTEKGSTIFPKKEIFIDNKIIDNSENKNKQQINLLSNKIILGSKPSRTINKDCNRNQLKPYCAKVILNNINSYLDNSKRFCKKCLILFPTKQYFYIHQTKFHKMKNVGSIQFHQHTKFQCKFCNTKYANSGNLYRHMRNIHGTISKRIRRARTIQVDSTQKLPDHTNDTSVRRHACFHCKEIFEDQNSLIEHMYNVLKPSNAKNNTKESHTSKMQQEIITMKRNYKKMLTHHTDSVTKTSIKKLPEKSIRIELSRIDNCIDLKTQDKIKIPEEVHISQDSCPKKNKTKKVIYKNIEHKAHETILRSVYKCPLCSHCVQNLKTFITHMAKKHKKEDNTNITMVKFDPKCPYCPAKNNNIFKYNKHLIRVHKNIFRKTMPIHPNKNIKINNSSKNISLKHNSKHDIASSKVKSTSTFALKSILFKCNKCDILFVSSNLATNHSKHMDILINWKCLSCQKIFKKKDKNMHKKQHDFHYKFTVYNLDESTPSKILYSCPKCAVHFTEESYSSHYPICGVDTPNSLYCKVCDILIDEKEMTEHDFNHTSNNLKSSDFIIVEAEPIFETVNNNTKRSLRPVKSTSVSDQITGKDTLNTDPSLHPMLSLSYCNNCNSFVSYIGITRKSHLLARCSHIIKHVCKHCGLVFTNKSATTHQQLHRKLKLTLQDFKFYDLRTKNQMRPPIPEYPQCDECQTHFTSKLAKQSHECIKVNYMKCQNCGIKLSEAAYKLHMKFHNYKIHEDSENKLCTNISDEDTEPITEETKNDQANVKKLVLMQLYSCSVCRVTLDTYDKMIEHCQSNLIRHSNELLRDCSICSLQFTQNDYEPHKMLHERMACKEKDFQVVTFDIEYFTANADTWMKHIFGSVSKENVADILCKSMYRYECRVKMEVIQDGPTSLTVYKCAKCRGFVDPNFVFEHVETPCFVQKKYPCCACGLPFVLNSDRICHEQIHKNYKNIILKSYKIVIFNRDLDKSYVNAIKLSMNNFVLYQCRNCNGIVSKLNYAVHRCNNQQLQKCTDCGLLLYKDEYQSHLSKHTNLINYNSYHIKVVLIGYKNKTDNTVYLIPSFTGEIRDYTFHQCLQCSICVHKHQIHEHKCSTNPNRSKCSKCHKFFSKHNNAIHTMLHDCLENDKNCIFFNKFQPTYREPSKKTEDYTTVQQIENDSNFVEFNNEVTSIAKETSNSKDTFPKRCIAILYKCNCNLHFLEEKKLDDHMKTCHKKLRIARQNCSKCGLLFIPSSLFDHILKHHGDKTQKYEFVIIKVFQNNGHTFYNCYKCLLNFTNIKEINTHIDICDGKIHGKECESCKLQLGSSCFYGDRHIGCVVGSEHNMEVDDCIDNGPHNVTENQNNIDTLQTEDLQEPSYSMSREFLEKMNLSSYSNTLFKCQRCDIHFMTRDALRIHRNGVRHIRPKQQDKCRVCGLRFTLFSLAKHVYVHHEKFQLHIKDLVITDKYTDDTS